MPLKDVCDFIDAIDDREMNLGIPPFVSKKLRELVEFTDEHVKDTRGRFGQLKNEIKHELCEMLCHVASVE